MKPYDKLKAIKKILNGIFLDKFHLRLCDIVKSDVDADGIIWSAVVYDIDTDTFFRMQRNTLGKYHVEEDDFYRLYTRDMYEYPHAPQK